LFAIKIVFYLFVHFYCRFFFDIQEYQKIDVTYVTEEYEASFFRDETDREIRVYKGNITDDQNCE
jgi:hypothetical protein